MENLIYALIFVLSNGLFFNPDIPTKDEKPPIEINDNVHNSAPDTGGDNDDDEPIKPSKV